MALYKKLSKSGNRHLSSSIKIRRLLKTLLNLRPPSMASSQYVISASMQKPSIKKVLHSTEKIPWHLKFWSNTSTIKLMRRARRGIWTHLKVLLMKSKFITISMLGKVILKSFNKIQINNSHLFKKTITKHRKIT